MKLFFSIFFSLLCFGVSSQKAPDGFILIPETISFNKNQGSVDSICTEAFEICDHPVTNLEYQAFIKATGYAAPLHWTNGQIPEGKEEYPVLYINRDDVDAYLDWLITATGKIYRLPTSNEFEAAAFQKGKRSRYYWGDSEKELISGQINFDREGNRKFDQWEQYLKPARWGKKNDAGLYQMAGNVWQLISDNNDPAVSTYKYRIETPSSMERTIMGGSWTSTTEYMVCGKRFAQSPGIRYPDLGFRLVRCPEGKSWKKISRRLALTSTPKGNISISWALLKNDVENIRFNIYRLTGDSRPHKGFLVNGKPIAATSLIDEHAIMKGSRYQYRIASVDQKGKEIDLSEWVGITAGADSLPIVVSFKPLFDKGGMTPVFGDLEGWGRKGCVIRLDNGNAETSQDPGIPVQLEAFSSTGRSLWRKNIAWHGNIFGSASNAPFNVWDMDGDGKDEVITFLQIGEDNYVSILDGMSGMVRYKALWTPMASDFSKSSTRIQMSIAYLDGKTPSIITQTGIYENEVISAYDSKLNKLWDYKSFMATNGGGGHKIEVADIDGDEKQEIVYGTTCLNTDGSLRWSIYRQHPDIISIHDYIPERPGLEVFYIVESSMHAGVYMVDANSGEVIWKNNRADDPLWSHGHSGWTSDIWEGSAGLECISNRMGHNDKNYLLFSAIGKKVMENFPSGFSPFEWDGDDTRELFGKSGKIVGNFNGKEITIIPGEVANPVPNTSVIFSGDLYGDFRSELIVSGTDTDGRKAVMVVTAPTVNPRMFVSPSENLDYRLWLSRNKGGGYGSVFDGAYKKPSHINK